MSKLVDSKEERTSIKVSVSVLDALKDHQYRLRKATGKQPSLAELLEASVLEFVGESQVATAQGSVVIEPQGGVKEEHQVLDAALSASGPEQRRALLTYLRVLAGMEFEEADEVRETSTKATEAGAGSRAATRPKARKAS